MATDGPEFDVVVVGSGAAGHDRRAHGRAARPGTVVAREDRYRFGGSTARSGGGIWAPGNEVLRKAGIQDTAGQAPSTWPGGGRRLSPANCSRPFSTAARPWSRSSARPPRSTSRGYRVTPTTTPRPRAGWRRGAASSRCRSTAGCSGPELAHLNPPYLPAPPGVTVTQADYRWLSLGTRHPRAIWPRRRSSAARPHAVLGQRLLSMGQALATGLRAGLAARNVPVWLNTPMTWLHLDRRPGHGREVTRDGQPARDPCHAAACCSRRRLRAQRQLRQRYQRAPIGTDWTTGSPGNTGDGIIAGEAVGGALGLMDDAWWGPSIPLTGGPYFCLAERSLPGCILVNGGGPALRQRVRALRRHRARDVRGPRRRQRRTSRPGWSSTSATATATCSPACRRASPLPRRWYAAGAVFRRRPWPNSPPRSAWTPRAWPRP